MQDVCLSSTRVALEFYRAARDAILLYEAIVPVKVSAWRKRCKFKIYLKTHLIMLLLWMTVGITSLSISKIYVIKSFLKYI